MSNIIRFPRRPKLQQPEPPETSPPRPAPPVPPQRAQAAKPGVIGWVVRVVWVLTAMVWPILKWIVSIEVFFKFVRMLWHWNTPGVHAGWTFLLHFAVLTALTWFVGVYKPKGI